VRIAILDSGGVGGIVVGTWPEQAGSQAVFIAGAAHLAALREDGLRVAAPISPAGLDCLSAAAVNACSGGCFRAPNLADPMSETDRQRQFESLRTCHSAEF